jgi:hypothetical protein
MSAYAATAAGTGALGYIICQIVVDDSPSTTVRMANTVVGMLAALAVTVSAVSCGIVGAVIVAIKLGPGHRQVQPPGSAGITVECRQPDTERE